MTDIESLVDLLPRGRALRNYVVPGLTSTLLASTEGGGKLRLFEMDREQEHYVVPHDHRYDFTAFVLAGMAEQIAYDVHHVSTPGEARWAAFQYLHRDGRLAGRSWGYFAGTIRRATYLRGDSYRMGAKEWHSIRFGAGSRVLMVEGAGSGGYSSVLLPMVNGRLCDTFLVRDWMMEEA